MISIRNATADDFDRFARDRPPWRVRAWAAELDGAVIGLGGIAFPPGCPPVAFVEIDDIARAHPVALHRTGRRFMDAMRAERIPKMIATTDAANETARRWLARLGFVEVALTDGKRVHEWVI